MTTESNIIATEEEVEESASEDENEDVDLPGMVLWLNNCAIYGITFGFSFFPTSHCNTQITRLDREVKSRRV